MRIVHRGAYFPGWDVVGAANGLRLVSTHSWRELLHYYEIRHFDPSLAWNVFGVPVALLPGFLASRWPWEFWPHVVTPCLVALSLGLLLRALAVRAADAWTCALAIGASPTFLSYTVSGFPYVSGILPWALALWIVFRWQQSIVGTVLLGALCMLTSRHVQELGRLSFAVPLAAALLLPGPRKGVRALWLLLAAAQMWLAIHYASANTARYATMVVPPLAELAGHVGTLVHHFAAQRPDLPILLAAGIVAALAAGRERWFWSALLLFLLGLLVLLAANSGPLQGIVGVWPRRVLVLDFVCIASCVAVMRRPGRVRPLVVSLLVVGNLWQLADTVAWARKPVGVRSNAGSTYALPYTHTPIQATASVEESLNLDSHVSRLCVDWYHEMKAELAAGHRLFLVYNLTSFDENATDPAGIIDRLYLSLGHAAFMRSVLVFGEERFRVNELPIRPMKQLPKIVASMTRPSSVRGYWLHHPQDDQKWPAAQAHREEVATILGVLAMRFRLVWGPSTDDVDGRALHRFSLTDRDSPPDRTPSSRPRPTPPDPAGRRTHRWSRRIPVAGRRRSPGGHRRGCRCPGPSCRGR